MEDCLVVSVDISRNDEPTMLVTRSENALSFKVINELRGDEAVETYNKLIGNVKKCCKTCKHSCGLCCMHPKHLGDYIQLYTVCDEYEK